MAKNVKNKQVSKSTGLQPLYLHLAAVTILGIATSFYLFWFVRLVPVIVMPLIVAVILHLIAPKLDRTYLMVVSGVSVFLGFLTAAYFLRLENLEAFAKQWGTLNPDTMFGVFQNLVISLPFSIYKINALDLLMLAIFESALATLISYLIATAKTSWSYQFKQLLPHIFIGILVLNLLAASLLISDNLVIQLSTEPSDESYKYDAYIYLKAFYKVAAGENYYTAIPQAILSDGRMNQLSDMISGYTTIRMPTVFFIWRAFTGGNGGNIFYLSLLLAIVALTFVFYGMRMTSGEGIASLGSMLVAPYLYIGSTWVNILFPDWWAILFGLIAIGLFLQKQYAGAAAIALLSTLSREPMGILIFAGLLAGIAVKERRIWLPFGAAILSFVVLYLAHKHMVTASMPLESAGLAQRPGLQITSFLTTSNYLMYPFSLLRLNLIIPFAAIVAAFLQKEWVNRMFIAVFILSFVLYLLVMKATASYWGQMFMPVVLLSLPFALQLYFDRGECQA